MDRALADAVQGLENQVRRAASEIESLRGARSNLEEQRLALEQKHQELEGVKTVLDKSCKKLERENQKLQASNDELRKEVEELAVAARGVAKAQEVDSTASDLASQIEQLEDTWNAEKGELRTRVKGIVSGLENLLESTRA